MKSLMKHAIFCVMAMLLGFGQVFAQVRLTPEAETFAGNALAQLLFKVEDMRIRVENIHILSQYCKPPREPSKSVPQFEINLEALLFKQLDREFDRVEKSFKEAEKQGRMSLSSYGTYPPIDGLRPDPTKAGDTRDYWARAKGLLTQVQNLLAKKQEQLNKAKEVNCAPEEAKQQPTKGPESPPDPLAGLTRSKPRDINIPQLPHYFCSKQARTEFWKSFEPEWLEAAENVEDAAHYRAEVSRRGAEHFNKDGDPAQQKRLDAEERWADKNFAQQLRMRDRVDAIRDMILNTPIIDCSLLSKNTAPDPTSLGVRAERITDDIKNIDSRIKEIDRKLAEIKAEVDNEIPSELDEAYERGLLEWEGQEGFDLDRWLRGVDAEKHDLRRQQRELLWQKEVLQAELKRVNELIDNLQKADAGTAGTPRPSAEPVQKIEEKRPSWLESLMPVLIPSISIGIGGGKHGGKHREWERK